MSIVETLKIAIRNKQTVKYMGQTIDMQTANALAILYDSLNYKNKLKFIRLAKKDLPLLIDFAWKMVR